MLTKIRPSAAALAALCLLAAACRSDRTEIVDTFHTSGSRDADQRAEQRVMNTEQVRDEKKTERKQSLYERLGAEAGIRRICDDFVERAMADPRVNWRRKGVRKGGVLGMGVKSAEWSAGADGVAQLKQHVAQFIAVATGGPSSYSGREIREVHKGMHVTNAEFDATIGDMKATLDALDVPTVEQKELLAVLESTRPQIAEER